MSLKVACPDCHKVLKLKEENAGKKIRCPQCSSVIAVPRRDGDDGVEDVEEVDEDQDAVRSSSGSRRRRGTSGKAPRGVSAGTVKWVILSVLGGGIAVVCLFCGGILLVAFGKIGEAVQKADAARELRDN